MTESGSSMMPPPHGPQLRAHRPPGDVFMPVPNVVTAIPGPRSLAMYERERGMIAPGLQSVTQWSRVCFSHGDGCVLFDVDGNSILDFMAGVAVCSIGHGHPAFAQA